jgi:hypothetical protein
MTPRSIALRKHHAMTTHTIALRNHHAMPTHTIALPESAVILSGALLAPRRISIATHLRTERRAITLPPQPQCESAVILRAAPSAARRISTSALATQPPGPEPSRLSPSSRLPRPKPRESQQPSFSPAPQSVAPPAQWSAPGDKLDASPITNASTSRLLLSAIRSHRPSFRLLITDY